jgi:hypothetical protein
MMVDDTDSHQTMNRDLLYLTLSIVDESHADGPLAEPYATMPE